MTSTESFPCDRRVLILPRDRNSGRRDFRIETAEETVPPAVEEAVVDVTEPSVTYLVKFAPGAAAQGRQNALNAAGGKTVGSIASFGIELIDFPASSHAAKSKALAKNPNVVYVAQNFTREVAAFELNDTNYAGQWSLPKIGWDLAYEVIDPAGTALVAVLDTGIDGTHDDIDGKVVPAP